LGLHAHEISAEQPERTTPTSICQWRDPTLRLGRPIPLQAWTVSSNTMHHDGDAHKPYGHWIYLVLKVRQYTPYRNMRDPEPVDSSTGGMTRMSCPTASLNRTS